MSQILNIPISSTNAIKSTITTDALVFRWFLYLIGQKEARSDLVADSATYARLKKAIITQNICLILLLAVSVYIFLTKNFIILCAVAALLFIYFKLRQGVREHVALLSLKIIAKHFNTDRLRQHTLYQIGERLADHYHVRSLVMSMTSVDAIIRRVILYAFLFVSCVVPFDFLPFWGMLFAVYWAAHTIVNTAVVYNHLS